VSVAVAAVSSGTLQCSRRHGRLLTAFADHAAACRFDCRIPATVDLAVFKAQLDDWCGEDGVSYEWVSGTGQGALANPTTSVAPDR